MRVRAGVVTALVAGALALTACGPTVPGGGAAPAVAPTTTSSAPSSTSTSPSTTASTPTSTPTTEATTSSAPTTAATTAAPAAAAYLLAPGANGDQVRVLQSRLEQLQWYDGDVTGSYDDRTTAAVRGFQDKRGMPASGSVDQATWDALNGMTRTPTDDELHNRRTPGPALLKQGATGDPVRTLQARLKQIGWWSGDVSGTYDATTVASVKAFQDKRAIPVTGEVDQRTLDRLNGMTRTPTSDELNNVKPAPAPAASTTGLDPRCLTGHTLCISKATRSLTWVVDGQAQLKLDVRFGDENNPTREGLFSVYIKQRDWTSTLYGSKMPYSMFFSGGEAVHYSSDFAARGYNGHSHGCVNVRDLAGIAWLFDQVSLGDKVVVY